MKITALRKPPPGIPGVIPQHMCWFRIEHDGMTRHVVASPKLVEEFGGVLLCLNEIVETAA